MTGHETLFIASVESAFAFLWRDHGFELAGTVAETNSQGFANYRVTFLRTVTGGKWQTVAVQTTPGRGELYVDLAWGTVDADSPELRLTLGELHEIESSKPTPTYSVSRAFGDRDRMNRQYRDLATQLRDYGDRFFGFDETLAADVDALRRMPRNERERRQKDRVIEDAIATGQWERAVVYLEGLEDSKTPEQRELLKTARAIAGLGIRLWVPPI